MSIKDQKLIVRPAVPADGPVIYNLIQAFADFEKLTPPDEAAHQRMMADAFAERPRFEIFLAELNGAVVGYTFIFETYSTFSARPKLYLEDIFVLPEHRGSKVGFALFRHCVAEADRRGCVRMEWAVLDWNVSAQKFYQRLGGRPSQEWLPYVLTQERFEDVLNLPDPTAPATEPPAALEAGTVSVFEMDKIPAQGWLDKIGGSELICRRITEADLMQHTMDQAGNYVAGDAARRLAAGQQGYIVELPDVGPVSYGWVTQQVEPLGNSGMAFQPAPGDAYLYDFATLPAHRGHGYYPALLRFIVTELVSQQIRRAWIGTAPGNAVSARSIARAGFRLVSEVWTVPPSAPGESFRFEVKPAPGLPPELFEAGQRAHIPWKA